MYIKYHTAQISPLNKISYNGLLKVKNISMNFCKRLCHESGLFSSRCLWNCDVFPHQGRQIWLWRSSRLKEKLSHWLKILQLLKISQLLMRSSQTWGKDLSFSNLSWARTGRLFSIFQRHRYRGSLLTEPESNRRNHSEGGRQKWVLDLGWFW